MRFKNFCTPLLLSAFIGISGCAFDPKSPLDPEKNDFHDRAQGLSRDDYKNMARPEGEGSKKTYEPHYEPGDPKTKVDLGEPPIPDIANILAAPRPPEIGQTQLVSIFVTDDVPLKDVLIELARLADVDVEIDPQIQGGIVFRAQNRPFNEVIERVAQLSGLRYTMKDNVLRVERDTPYVKTYPLDFLSFTRSTSSNMDISTSVLSSGGGGESGGSSGGGGLTSGSGASITYEAEGDFWEHLEQGVQDILAFQSPTGLGNGVSTLVADSAPAAEVSPAQPEAPAAGMSSQMPGGGSSGSVLPSGAPSLPTPPGGAVQAAPAAPAAAAASGGSLPAGVFFVANRQGGTLTVSGSDRQHKMVADYLQQLKDISSSQVLIEAKIIEVTLDENFESGVNWSEVFSSKYVTADAGYSNVSTTDGLTQLLIGGDSLTDPSLDALVNLTESFGTTRTLSSPRIHAMNNQQAMLTFAKNFVYFDVDIEQTQSTGTGASTTNITFDATPVTVPVGIIISLQPSINARTGEITMSVRPTLSRIAGTKPDPSVAYLISTTPSLVDSGIENNVPEIEVRELDSLMRMRSGQVMVLGGLMEQSGTNNDSGVPYVSGVPWFGNAFKNTDKTQSVKELFFLIKATIVGSQSDMHPVDKDIYKKFTTDHRPLAF